MAITGNHYQTLGLDPSASAEQISHGLDQLARRADLLAYTSPQRSRELWERVRIMRHDLLDADRRARYDRALLRAGVSAPALATVVPVAREEKTNPRSMWLPAIPAALAGAITAAVATAAVVSSLQSPGPLRSPALAMLSAGKLQHGLYASGQPVTLGWSRDAHADRYELEVFTAPVHGIAGRRLEKDITTRLSAYSLPVVGEQRYLWRVRAHVNGRWTAWSALRALTVAAPSLVRPSVIFPQDHTMLNGPSVRLCWSPVEGATSYHVRIQGIGGMTVHGTCTSVRVAPGLHRWTVAALAHGTQRYWSEYTARHYFSVGAEVAALAPSPRAKSEPKSRTHHTSASHAHHAAPHVAPAAAHSTSGTKSVDQPVRTTLVAAVVPSHVERVVTVVRRVTVLRVAHRVAKAVSSGARRVASTGDKAAVPAPTVSKAPAHAVHATAPPTAPAQKPSPTHVKVSAPAAHAVATTPPHVVAPATGVAATARPVSTSVPAAPAASGSVVLQCVPGGMCAVQHVPAQQGPSAAPTNYTYQTTSHAPTVARTPVPVVPVAPPVVAPPPAVHPTSPPPVSPPVVTSPPTSAPATGSGDQGDNGNHGDGNNGNHGDKSHSNNGKHLGKK